MAQVKTVHYGQDKVQARIISGDSVGARLTAERSEGDIYSDFRTVAQSLADKFGLGRLAFLGSGISSGSYTEIFESQD